MYHEDQANVGKYAMDPMDMIKLCQSCRINTDQATAPCRCSGPPSQRACLEAAGGDHKLCFFGPVVSSDFCFVIWFSLLNQNTWYTFHIISSFQYIYVFLLYNSSGLLTPSLIVIYMQASTSCSKAWWIFDGPGSWAGTSSRTSSTWSSRRPNLKRLDSGHLGARMKMN